ncbi:MAG: hypothetical protein AB3N14_03070, partial [Flavobacteriaceae bacterium]
SCKYWWRYAILSGIILNTYQLWEAMQEDIMWIDETEYLRSLPYILILAAILIGISEIVRYQSKTLDLYDSICQEIDELLAESNEDNGNVQLIKNEFANLKNKSATIEHLNELKLFRESLQQKIDKGASQEYE